MERIIRVLLVAVAIIVAIPVQAQVKFGVTGGLNMPTKMAKTWKYKLDTGGYTGYFIGPMVEYGTSLEGLAFDGALTYSEKGHKIEGETFKRTGLEVPLNIKYSYDFGRIFGLYANAGPGLFFNFNSSDPLTINNVTGEMQYQSFEVSLHVGGGIRLYKHLQIGASYSAPCMKSAKAYVEGTHTGTAWTSIKNKSYRTRVWQVSATYIF